MRILVFGTFDRLHPGHRFVLAEAMKRGEVLVVVARDANVERLKGRRPDQTEGERASALRRAFPRLTVMLGDPSDFLVPVRTVKPNLVLLGYDQTLPPGVCESDFPCPVERLRAHRPGRYKSSLRRRGPR